MLSLIVAVSDKAQVSIVMRFVPLRVERDICIVYIWK